MAYFWVAMGGAIGSIGRFYLGNVMVRLAGPQFPWGTILINVLGSFIIALAASLTGPGGRLAAPIELRLFVMVGVCGGFTTFSSFSLQTLELLRGGRPGEALANALLSVVICILAAALGYWAGLALATRPEFGSAG